MIATRPQNRFNRSSFVVYSNNSTQVDQPDTPWVLHNLGDPAPASASSWDPHVLRQEPQGWFGDRFSFSWGDGDGDHSEFALSLDPAAVPAEDDCQPGLDQPFCVRSSRVVAAATAAEAMELALSGGDHFVAGGAPAPEMPWTAGVAPTWNSTEPPLPPPTRFWTLVTFQTIELYFALNARLIRKFDRAPVSQEFELRYQVDGWDGRHVHLLHAENRTVVLECGVRRCQPFSVITGNEYGLMSKYESLPNFNTFNVGFIASSRPSSLSPIALFGGLRNVPFRYRCMR